MKKFKIEFNYQAIFKDVIIEAENKEEAEDKIYDLSFDELLKDGYIKVSEIDNIKVEEVK